MKVFTTHLDQNLIVKIIKIKIIKKQQNNNIDTKPSKFSDYLKSLSQKTKDLMNGIEDANKDIEGYKLASIGSNRERFNFNIFRMPVSFLSAIYNGEISLKEAEFSQRKIEKKIEKLKFGYRPETAEEKEEINGVLMQENDLLEYRDKIIDAFKNGSFLSEHLKTSDDAAHDHVLEDVKDFIQKIKSMSQNINPSLFKVLNRIKQAIQNVSENKTFKTEEKKKIINIVERIFYFNQLEQKGEGSKIVTPNQMFRRLPITLAQLKAGNNSENLKNEIRKLLYSLYRSKKLTRQLYKSLLDII